MQRCRSGTEPSPHGRGRSCSPAPTYRGPRSHFAPHRRVTTVRSWVATGCRVGWSTSCPPTCVTRSWPTRRPSTPGTTSHRWPATSSFAGLRTPSGRRRENAGSAERRRSWRKVSVGRAAGPDAITACERAGKPTTRGWRISGAVALWRRPHLRSEGVGGSPVRVLRCASYRPGSCRRHARRVAPGCRRAWPPRPTGRTPCGA